MQHEHLTHHSKSRVVEQYLRGKIQRGEIQPGQRLLQDLLAEQLGVSSTPVREALRRLETEGLVVHIPNKGVTVTDATQLNISEVCALRVVLEGHATRLATALLSDQDLQLLTSLHQTMAELVSAGDLQVFSAINDRWHSIIYRAAGSRLLEKTIRNTFKLSPVDDLWTIPGRAACSVEEHEHILRALLARDADEASKAMVDHIRIGERFLLDFVGNKTEGRKPRLKNRW